jgi:hypothetical protein
MSIVHEELVIRSLHLQNALCAEDGDRNRISGASVT